MKINESVLNQVSLLLFALVATSSWTKAEEADLDMRLRVTWNGKEKSAIGGTITVSRGSISDVRRLGPNQKPDAAEATPTQVRFSDDKATDFDGFDMTVKSSLDASLTIRLSPGPGSSRLYKVDLCEIVKKGYHRSEDGGRRIMVRAAPGDRLRVDIHPSRFRFDSGEMLSLSVGIHNLGLPEGTMVLFSVELLDADEKRQISPMLLDLHVDSRGKVVPAVEPISIRVPDVEGRFILRISLTRQDGTRTHTTGRPRTARRSLPTLDFQLVVTKEASQKPRNDGFWNAEVVDRCLCQTTRGIC